MKKTNGFFIFMLCLFACDNGDVINLNLDFDKELELCEINIVDQNTSENSSFIFYDTKNGPFESLSLIIPNNSTTQLMFNPNSNGDIQTIEIDGNTTRFNYRSYSSDPTDYFCNVIAPSNLNILNDYYSTSGTANFLSNYIDDDNDGIPTSLELNLDTDNDGIPNYIDSDDDGDNVLTVNENPDPNNDGDPSDAQDTDGDLIPDFLDTDDDNDGVLTINEDENGNGNLFDDIATGSTTARFLDENFSELFTIPFVNTNIYFRTVSITITLTNINISILSSDFLELGSYETIIQM